MDWLLFNKDLLTGSRLGPAGAVKCCGEQVSSAGELLWAAVAGIHCSYQCHIGRHKRRGNVSGRHSWCAGLLCKGSSVEA